MLTAQHSLAFNRLGRCAMSLQNLAIVDASSTRFSSSKVALSPNTRGYSIAVGKPRFLATADKNPPPHALRHLRNTSPHVQGSRYYRRTEVFLLGTSLLLFSLTNESQ